MKSKQKYWTSMIAAICLVLLIINSQIALQGAREGIELVLQAVIPALFPFMIATSVLNYILIGKKICKNGRFGAICGIPSGAETIFFLGILGGYPLGAKMIRDAYVDGQLDRSTAHRLLGFCNNAGPAFIFGMLGQLFTKPLTSFVIWGIHILGALIVGLILPHKSLSSCQISVTNGHNFTKIIENCVRTMAVVSAWIILWRVALAFCSHYFLLKLPVFFRVIFTGTCELTNGCLMLNAVENESLRFIIASCLLSGGGLCIALQTRSVTAGLGTGMYFPGKILQVIISFTLSAIISYGLYPTMNPPIFWIFIPIALLLFCIVVFVIVKKIK